MGRLTIAGMGTASSDHMTKKAIDCIRQADEVYLRTIIHRSAEDIKQQREDLQSFDALYESSANFDMVYEAIADELIDKAKADRHILYLVPGSPSFAEASVKQILARAAGSDIDIEVLPSVSFVDAILSSMTYDGADGFKLIDALKLKVEDLDKNCVILLCQIYDNLIAAEVKLILMEYYAADKPIYVIQHAGEQDAVILSTALYKMDRKIQYDHMTSIFIPADTAYDNTRDFQTLLEIMDKLRAEDGCDWDKAQTHDSLKRYLIEESYEVLDAIEAKDSTQVCEELGDVLLQIVFHAQIAAEDEQFDIRDVIQAINTKMLNRHPHVFKNRQMLPSDDVQIEWEQIKRKEKGYQGLSKSLHDVPKHLPALLRADRVQDKAKKFAFDFENISQICGKIEEELKEFTDALAQNDHKQAADELGDLLFSIVNMSRFLGINSEDALNKSTQKFIGRITKMEDMAFKEGSSLSEMNLNMLNDYWEKVKNKENTKE